MNIIELKKRIMGSQNESAKALMTLLEKDLKDLEKVNKEYLKYGGITKVVPKMPIYTIKKDLEMKITDRLSKLSRMMEKEVEDGDDAFENWIKGKAETRKEEQNG